MAIGLEIRNSAGGIVLDQDHPLLGLVASGTGVTANQGQHTGGSVISSLIVKQPANLQYPFMALKCDYPAYVERGYKKITPSEWEFTIRVFGTNNTPVSWYIFDKLTSSSATMSGGIEVFNASGELCFFTQLKPVRIKGVTTQPGNHIFGTGRDYAAVHCRQLGFLSTTHLNEPGPGYRYTQFRNYQIVGTKNIDGGINVSYNTVWNTRVNYNTLPVPPDTVINYGPGLILMVDVTGY